MQKILSTPISEELYNDLNRYFESMKYNKSATFREILEKAIEEKKSKLLTIDNDYRSDIK